MNTSSKQATIGATTCSLKDLVIDAEEFSPRHLKLDQAHVDVLEHGLELGRPLDRLTVWATDGKLVLVDGHHRAEAYRRARWKLEVPIFTFEGTLADAHLKAVWLNSKTRLALTTAERADAAWKLVRTPGRPTLEKIALGTGVSPRTVKTMSVRHQEMKARDIKITGMWWQDRNELVGTPWTEEEAADWREARAAQIAEKHKGLGREFGVNMDAASRAIARLAGKGNLRGLIQELTEIAEEEGLDWEEARELSGDFEAPAETPAWRRR